MHDTDDVLEWGELSVGAAGDGTLRLASADSALLTGWGPVALLVDDEEIRLGAAERIVLHDEIQLAWQPLPGVDVSVRHGFAGVWAQRAMVRVAPQALSPAGTGITSVALVWRLEPGPDAEAWVAPAGAAGTIALLPYAAGEPMVGLRLVGGALEGRPERPTSGRVSVGRDGATVVVADLVGEAYADAEQFAQVLGRAARTDWLPGAEDLAAGEPLVLRHDDGVLSEAGDPLATDADGTWLVDASGASRRSLIMDDAAGRTTLALRWAPTLHDLLARATTGLLAGPLTHQGAPRLSDASAAALVGWAVAIGAVEADDADRGEDAVADWLARNHGPSVWGTLAAVQEYQRTGEDGLLAHAAEQLETLTAGPQAEPGLALVGTQVVLALLTAGRDARPALAGLRQVGGGGVDDLGRAELALVLGSRFGGQHDAGQADALVQGGWRAVARLGGGLRGRPVTDVDAVTRARAATLCALLPGVGDPFLHRTAQPIATLARTARNRLLAELADEVDLGPLSRTGREALLWLGLGGPELIE